MPHKYEHHKGTPIQLDPAIMQQVETKLEKRFDSPKYATVYRDGYVDGVYELETEAIMQAFHSRLAILCRI